MGTFWIEVAHSSWKSRNGEVLEGGELLLQLGLVGNFKYFI